MTNAETDGSAAADSGKNLRILVLIDALGRGGAENVAFQSAQSLSSRGHDVVMVYMKERHENVIADRAIAAGLRVVYLPVTRLASPGGLFKVLKTIRGERPDVIHAHLQYARVFAGLARLLFKIPAVSTVHTQYLAASEAKQARREGFEDMMARKFHDATICLSPRMIEDRVKAGDIREKLVSIPNALPMAQFLAPGYVTGAEVRAQFGIPADAFVFSSIAVFREPKGLHVLIPAFKAAFAEDPTRHLLLVGDGPEADRLHALAQETGIADRIHFAGFQQDVRPYLDASNVFVIPSFTEAFPTSIIEAMAFGLPVIASDVAGIPDMVFEGEHGRLVPVSDEAALTSAMQELSSDTGFRTKAAEAARQRAQNEYDIEVQTDRLLNLYRSLIQRVSG